MELLEDKSRSYDGLVSHCTGVLSSYRHDCLSTVLLNLQTSTLLTNLLTNNKHTDAWTQDGILEYYWGEHIHLGYYSDEDMAKGFRSWRKKDFKQAKFDFTDKMMAFGGFGTTTNYGEGKDLKVLDVGCGVGGSSRYIARALGPQSDVTGITLSPNQVKRATELAEEQSTPNAKFQVMNALEMDFPDNSFDIVWHVLP